MNKNDESKKVFVKINNEWVEGKISTYIGNEKHNPRRELVEVHSFEFGYEVLNACDVHFEIPILKPEPAKLPTWAVGWCHYCGMPARSFGFFDEPTCSGCGG